jgi:cytochrome c biogenesis protein CcdA
MAEFPPDLDRRRKTSWLFSIEMLGTTIVVLMIGALMLWFKAVVHDSRSLITIGGGLLIYALSVVGFGLWFSPSYIAVWPFILAGGLAGGLAELVNAEFLVTREFLAALVTGAVIGFAHWAALRSWLGLTEKRAA